MSKYAIDIQKRFMVRMPVKIQLSSPTPEAKADGSR